MLDLPPRSLFILSPVWRPGSWQIGRGSPADVKACTISPEEPLNLQDAGVLKQHLSVLSSWPPGSRGPTGHSWSKRLLVCPGLIENVDQLKCFAASRDSYIFYSLDTLFKYFPMIVCRVKMKSFPTSGKESGSGHWKLSVTGTMFVSICKAVESSCRKLSSSSTFLIGLGEQLDCNWFFKNLLLTRSKALGGKMRRKCWMSCNWKKKLSGKSLKYV